LSSWKNGKNEARLVVYIVFIALRMMNIKEITIQQAGIHILKLQLSTSLKLIKPVCDKDEASYFGIKMQNIYSCRISHYGQLSHNL
jgi:hypothetical protein